jgi:hypothetical protein
MPLGEFSMASPPTTTSVQGPVFRSPFCRPVVWTTGAGGGREASAAATAGSFVPAQPPPVCKRAGTTVRPTWLHVLVVLLFFPPAVGVRSKLLQLHGAVCVGHGMPVLSLSRYMCSKYTL